MKTLQVFGIGTFLLLAVFFILTGIGAAFGRVTVRTGTATGLSAIAAGTILNPYFWAIVVLSYGAAFWFVRWRSQAH